MPKRFSLVGSDIFKVKTQPSPSDHLFYVFIWLL